MFSSRTDNDSSTEDGSNIINALTTFENVAYGVLHEHLHSTEDVVDPNIEFLEYFKELLTQDEHYALGIHEIKLHTSPRLNESIIDMNAAYVRYTYNTQILTNLFTKYKDMRSSGNITKNICANAMILNHIYVGMLCEYKLYNGLVIKKKIQDSATDA